jgi:hypothetical protein
MSRARRALSVRRTPARVACFLLERFYYLRRCAVWHCPAAALLVGSGSVRVPCLIERHKNRAARGNKA